jgi:hypothetical protein
VRLSHGHRPTWSAVQICFRMKKKTSWVAVAALMGLPLIAAAQANPADSGAPAPALAYQSAFSDYKPWQGIKPADWRAVNDTVRDAAARGGGHDGHGTAPAPAPAPAAAPLAPPRPAPPAPAPAAAPQAPVGHQGHEGHK